MGDRARVVEIPTRIPATASDLSVAAMDPVVQLILGYRVTFSDRLDPGVLARAVRRLLDVEPVLGCRALSEGVVSGVWRRCRNLDDAISSVLVETDDPDTDLAAFYVEALPEDGPRLVVRLLRSANADDLCMKVDHLVGDGWSAKELACLLAEAYTREAAEPPYSAESNLEPRPTPADVWDALTPEQREAATHRASWGLSKWKMTFHPGTGGELAVRVLTLAPDQLLAVKVYGRARGATVNEMLVTAMLRSLARMYPAPEDSGLSVSMTADLRRLTDDLTLRRIGNVSSGGPVGIAYDPDDSFDEALRKVVDAIRPWKECLWRAKSARRSLLPHRLMRVFWAAIVAAGRRGGIGSLSTVNIGIIDEMRLVFDGIVPTSACALGTIQKGPGFQVTMSAYRDTLTVWMGALQRYVDPALMEQALRGMSEQLRENVAGV